MSTIGRAPSHGAHVRDAGLSLAAFVTIVALATAPTASLVPARAAAQVGTGTRAPEIGLNDLNGRRVSIASLRGKVVVVDFWASWCGPCRESFPFWNRMQSRYGSQGLVLVGVTVDRDVANVRTFLRRNPAQFRIVHDPEHAVADRYRPATMPSTFIIDKRGVVRTVHRGFRSRDTGPLEQQIQALLR